MEPFEALSVRGQLGRLRRLAEAALADFGVRPAKLVPLAHLENTTFRVDAAGGERYVLRIHRVTGIPVHPVRSAAEVRSEMLWLSALRREAGLAVPEPIPTAGGDLLTIADAAGVPEPRNCVLLRWAEGRFLDAGLTPLHLERVGAFIARLHDHARAFAPPPGFVRGRIGDLSGTVAAHVADLVAQQCGPDASATVETVMSLVSQAQNELGTRPEVFGLIHADLHQENYLFHRGEVRAIDFDDCGWGHFVYDLTVTLSELRWRPDYEARRAGLLRGYRAVRPLPIEHERFIEVFHGLRMLHLTLWFLELRDHPSFSDWEQEVRYGLKELETFVGQSASFA